MSFSAGMLLSRRLLVATVARVNASRAMNSHETILRKIGNREIVGFGFNGQPNYADRVDFPFPAIRFKEPNSEILALREKEKGDWRKLSLEERKELYRSSFCQTFAEMKAPTGEWKMAVGVALMFISLGIWLQLALKVFVLKPLPESFTEERMEAQLKRMIALAVNPVTGISSRWDYEADDWKK